MISWIYLDLKVGSVSLHSNSRSAYHSALAHHLNSPSAHHSALALQSYSYLTNSVLTPVGMSSALVSSDCHYRAPWHSSRVSLSCSSCSSCMPACHAECSDSRIVVPCSAAVLHSPLAQGACRAGTHAVPGAELRWWPLQGLRCGRMVS